jgi:hypothetical protein
VTTAKQNLLVANLDSAKWSKAGVGGLAVARDDSDQIIISYTMLRKIIKKTICGPFDGAAIRWRPGPSIPSWSCPFRGCSAKSSSTAEGPVVTSWRWFPHHE